MMYSNKKSKNKRERSLRSIISIAINFASSTFIIMNKIISGPYSGLWLPEGEEFFLCYVDFFLLSSKTNLKGGVAFLVTPLHSDRTELLFLFIVIRFVFINISINIICCSYSENDII